MNKPKMALKQMTTTNEEQIAFVHKSNVGTYHADPNAEVAWTVNDTRGYTDGGPSCDECGACECRCEECGADGHNHDEACETGNGDSSDDDCIGLSFAFVCLDGGEALCEDCAEGVVEIVPCCCDDDDKEDANPENHDPARARDDC